MIHKGRIEGLTGSWMSGLGTLRIYDYDTDSIRDIPCENGATVRALDSAFGGVIGPGHTIDNENGKHVGQDVYWWYDELGLVLGGFAPVDLVTPETLEQLQEVYG